MNVARSLQGEIPAGRGLGLALPAHIDPKAAAVQKFLYDTQFCHMIKSVTSAYLHGRHFRRRDAMLHFLLLIFGLALLAIVAAGLNGSGTKTPTQSPPLDLSRPVFVKDGWTILCPPAAVFAAGAPGRIMNAEETVFGDREAAARKAGCILAHGHWMVHDPVWALDEHLFVEGNDGVNDYLVAADQLTNKIPERYKGYDQFKKAEAEFSACVERSRSPAWSEFAYPPSDSGAYEEWSARYLSAEIEVSEHCQRQEKDAVITICKSMERDLCQPTLDVIAGEIMAGRTACLGKAPLDCVP